MNLRTASLLCERFLSCVGDGKLLDQLGDVLAKGSVVSDATVYGGDASQDAIDKLSFAAKKALSSYDDSLFADRAMKIFPEYSQLGFAKIMAGDFEKCLKSMCDADGSGDDFSANLARIGREGEGISELTDQVERLMGVANYFGVESRGDFESDAIAVIQMPEGEAAEHAGGNVDAFVERMQSFQSIVEFCGVNDETGANIRMIAADDALVVADLSSLGAYKLQNIISDVKSAKSDIAEIENASKRLKSVGVDDKIINLLGEETNLVRNFDESKAGSFIKTLLNSKHRDTGKWMANAVMEFLESGVRIDSVALKPFEYDHALDVADEATETIAVADEMVVVADALEALDEEAVANDTAGSETSDQADEGHDTKIATTVSGAAALANVNSFAAKNGLGVAASAVEDVTQEATDLTGATSEKISEIKDEASDLADDVSQKVDEVVETASDAASKASEQLSTVVDDAKEAVSDDVSNGIEKVSDTVSSSVDETVKHVETQSEAEINATRARKKSLRSIWETFSGRS